MRFSFNVFPLDFSFVFIVNLSFSLVLLVDITNSNLKIVVLIFPRLSKTVFALYLK